MSRQSFVIGVVVILCSCSYNVVLSKNIEQPLPVAEQIENLNIDQNQSTTEVNNIIEINQNTEESVVQNVTIPSVIKNDDKNDEIVDKLPPTPSTTTVQLRQSILGLPEEIPELDNNLANRIKFIIYKDGHLVYSYDEYDKKQNVSLNLYCNGEGNITFIIHGWRESAETEWVQLLVTKYSQHRAGCVIAVDYEKIAYRPYSRLLTYYDAITEIIYSTITLWQSHGISLNKTHIFGFDFGGRIALNLGTKLGTDAVSSIDVCDIAGPGFDDKYPNIDYKLSAQNVQCIHTSKDKGTQNYSNCHQNWRLGVCGQSQIGSDMTPLNYAKYKTSHRICPYYYLLSFDEEIYAQDKPFECSATHVAANLPYNYKMGFLETRKSEVQGELFVSKLPAYSFKNSVNNNEATINRIMEYYREEVIGLKDSPSTIERFENTIISAIRSIEPTLYSIVLTIG